MPTSRHSSAAPGEVEHLALALANSAYVLPGHPWVDLLASRASARRWLVEHDLDAPGKDVDSRASRLRELRAHVRSLLEARSAGRPPPVDAVRATNAALRRAPAWSRLEYDAQSGWRRGAWADDDKSIDRALAGIASDLLDLVTGPHAAFIRQCDAQRCGRFLLSTHAHRRFCSTRCANRARSARAYARTHNREAAFADGGSGAVMPPRSRPLSVP